MHCRRFVEPGLSRRDMLLRCAQRFWRAGPGRACCASRPSAPSSATRRPSRTRRTGRVEPAGARPPHFPAKARSVIFLFMDGGPSQVDTFDPKPRLDREHGQPIKVKTHPTQFNNVGNVLALPLEVPPLRRERHPGQRPVSARRPVRRRPGDRPLDGLELLRAHQRQLLHAHRQRACRAGRAMGPGSPTAWGASARTCPASSSSTAA